MKFHNTRLGGFGAGLPADTYGFVTCSPGRVERAKAALLRGEDDAPVAWRYGWTNVRVAQAEIALAEWRKGGE